MKQDLSPTPPLQGEGLRNAPFPRRASLSPPSLVGKGVGGLGSSASISMPDATSKKSTRRTFLTCAAAVGAATAGAGLFLGGVNRVSRAAGKKVIVIGIDGMDPRLSESMMREGQLPNLAKMRAGGGFSPLGTSTPPQSPVAW